MLVITRFAVEPTDTTFPHEVERALSILRQAGGFESGELVRNLDEAGLWAVVTRWRDVGSYRRALQSYEAKLVVVPLLSRALDEPSAYDTAAEVGENRARGAVEAG